MQPWVGSDMTGIKTGPTIYALGLNDSAVNIPCREAMC